MGRQTGTRVFCLHGQSPPSPLLGLPGEEGVRASLARKRARPWCRGDTGRRRRVNAFVLPRGEIWTLRKPKLVSKKLRRVFRAPDLGAMLQAQRGEEARAAVWMGLGWCPGLDLGAGVIPTCGEKGGAPEQAGC